MKNFILAVLLALCAVTSYGAETTRITPTKVGALISIRDLAHDGALSRVEFSFRLGEYKAVSGNHLAVGIGNLYPFYDKGRPPQGSGFVVGQWNGCPDKGVVIAIEHYVLGVDSTTCYGPLSNTKTYKVVLRGLKQYFVSYAIYEGETLLAAFDQYVPNNVLGDYPTGFFLIPIDTGIASGAYELVDFKVFAE